jgi:hypothetical protein
LGSGTLARYNHGASLGGSPLNEPTLTSRTLDYVRNNWGNLASVAGLVVSAIAAFLAKGAKTAAKEARDVVLSSTLAEEINIAMRLAAEVGNLVDLGQHELARLRTNDLHDHALTIINRWDGTMPTVSKNNFLSAKVQLETLRGVTSKLIAAGAAPTPRQISQMQSSCARIRSIFVEEHASAMRRNDEANNG